MHRINDWETQEGAKVDRLTDAILTNNFDILNIQTDNLKELTDNLSTTCGSFYGRRSSALP